MNNSGELIDGEQREVIQGELKALSERHGLSVADLVQRASKERESEIKHYPGVLETLGKNNNLRNYVNEELGSIDPQVMQRQSEQFQPQLEEFCAKFGLEPNDKTSITRTLEAQYKIFSDLDKVLSQREDLYPGGIVKVRRSSGEIQDGWQIVGINDDGTFALRLPAEGGGYYPKNVRPSEVMNLNPSHE